MPVKVTVPVPVSIAATYEEPHSTLAKLTNAWSLLGRPWLLSDGAIRPRLQGFAAREGLGYLIGFLGASGTYDAMFAVVLTVAMLGFIADRIYLVLMHRMLRWQA